MNESTDVEDRRVAIIHAVWHVIGEQGMGAVSMRTVAGAAGVSVGRIQYWFRTKDELLRASLEAMLSGAAERHDTATTDVDDRDKLWHLISHPIPQADSSPAGVSVFHQYVAAGINHPALAAILADAQDGAENEAVRLLHRICPGGRDQRTAARTLIATAHGLAMRVLICNPDVADAERVLRAEVDRVTG